MGILPWLPYRGYLIILAWPLDRGYLINLASLILRTLLKYMTKYVYKGFALPTFAVLCNTVCACIRFRAFPF